MTLTAWHITFSPKKMEKKLPSTWNPCVDISIHISSTCWVGKGGGGQNTFLDKRNYKITNQGYAANLTSFWLGGPTHLHEMEAMKNETYYLIESSHNRSASI